MSYGNDTQHIMSKVKPVKANYTYTSIPLCKTTVTPVLAQCSYCSLALSDVYSGDYLRKAPMTTEDRAWNISRVICRPFYCDIFCFGHVYIVMPRTNRRQPNCRFPRWSFFFLTTSPVIWTLILYKYHFPFITIPIQPKDGLWQSYIFNDNYDCDKLACL